MTTYYVDFVNGLDANNGLGPDASHASNKPWKTLAKLLGAAGFASGDTAYLSPAGPFRETLTVNMTSATAETFVLGDPANAQGFKTSGGVLVAPGEVIWTAHTTNDTTAPAAAALCDLNGRDFLTFQDMTMYGGNNAPSLFNATTTNSINVKWTRCAMFAFAGSSSFVYVGLADIAANWTFTQCTLGGNAGQSTVTITLPTSASADYSSAILFENCLFFTGGRQISITASGAGAFKGGGVQARNCTFLANITTAMQTLSANIATAAPNQCLFYNNLVLSGNAGVNANASGQIVEDYNLFWGVSTPRTNVATGTNSDTNNRPWPVELGQGIIAGRQSRLFFTPTPGSTVLGFGNTTAVAQPTTDYFNRPKPAGGGSATATAVATGTATAGAATTLTNSGASYATNAYAGYTLRLTGGTGSGQQRIVTSNTATVLTISPAWATNPDNTSTYTLDNPGKYAGIGAFERHDTAAQETSTIQAGSSAIKIIGPGDHDFMIPVDASSTMISIYARYDTLHGTTNKPQAILLTNGEIGVTTETKTMTAAADTWEQLTFSSFTPTAKGFVRVRLVSRAAAGNGIAYFDTAAVV